MIMIMIKNLWAVKFTTQHDPHGEYAIIRVVIYIDSQGLNLKPFSCEPEAAQI
jgi:hypothetical protein